MKVKVNLSNQTLEYMDSQPYIQGTDTRNKLSVYIEHSTIPQTEGAFNIMIAYALQNGRTTIKMANTGATAETIDDVVYDVFYFTAPSVLTSVAGNFVATLILKVNTNLYKVNVLNTVLDAVEFETFESALEETEATIIENLESMSEAITGLQTLIYSNSISLSGASGTLTDEQLNVITTFKDPVIYYTDSIGVVFALQLKQKYQNEYTFILDVSTMVTNYVDVIKYSIIVYTNTKNWFFDTTHKYVSTKTYVDNAITTLQNNKADLTNSSQTITANEIVTKYISYSEGREDITLSNSSVAITFLNENEEYNTISTNEDAVGLYYGDDGAKVIADSTGVLLHDTRADGGANSVKVSPNAIRLKLQPESGSSTILELNDSGVFFTIPSGDSFKVNNVDIPNKTYVDATGHYISLAIDSDFKLTAILKDANNNTISTSNVIDLPLESVVVSGAYNSATKKVVLTLENGDTIEFSVADLVSGLQTEITAQNKLSADLIQEDSTHKFVTENEKTQITTNANDITSIKDGQSIDSFSDVETALGNILNGTTIDSFADVESALSDKEDTSNKVTSLSSSSTDTEYPSAKCVYDLIGDVETLLASI